MFVVVARQARLDRGAAGVDPVGLVAGAASEAPRRVRLHGQPGGGRREIRKPCRTAHAVLARAERGALEGMAALTARRRRPRARSPSRRARDSRRTTRPPRRARSPASARPGPGRVRAPGKAGFHVLPQRHRPLQHVRLREPVGLVPVTRQERGALGRVVVIVVAAGLTARRPRKGRVARARFQHVVVAAHAEVPADRDPAVGAPVLAVAGHALLRIDLLQGVRPAWVVEEAGRVGVRGALRGVAARALAARRPAKGRVAARARRLEQVVAVRGRTRHEHAAGGAEERRRQQHQRRSRQHSDLQPKRNPETSEQLEGQLAHGVVSVRRTSSSPHGRTRGFLLVPLYSIGRQVVNAGSADRPWTSPS